MEPTIKPVALMVSVPPPALASAHVTLVPEQAPERKSITGSNVEFPTTLIVGVAVVATNLYQTSSSAVPPHDVVKDVVLVAPTVVPDVEEQVEFCVKVVAEEQASLVGAEAPAPYTQMVKVPAVEE